MADVIYAISAGDTHSPHSDWKTFEGDFDAFRKEHRHFWNGSIPADCSREIKQAEDVLAETKLTVDDEDWILYPNISMKQNHTLRFYIRKSKL